MKEENIKEAILKLAELIDNLEDVSDSTRNNPHFRSREDLIREILNKK